MSFQRVTLESRKKRSWIPVSGHWDDRRRRRWNDIVGCGVLSK
ncbi:hypothetical protein [Wolbachia pipientis]|nr:hypothetical protein [Wolbachia pipientis]